MSVESYIRKLQDARNSSPAGGEQQRAETTRGSKSPWRDDKPDDKAATVVDIGQYIQRPRDRGFAFAALAGQRRWLGWRAEPRGKDGKPTKVPYAPHGGGRKADPTNPADWATRREAESFAAKFLDGAVGGIGIALGDLGDGTFLAGIDLDGSLDHSGMPFMITQEMRSTLLQRGHTAEATRNMTPQEAHAIIAKTGTLAQWAADILAVLPTYGEISPSGNGLKGFFRIRSDYVRPFLKLIGVAAKSWGIRRSIPGLSSADHGPGVECYAAGHFFTVTGRLWAREHPAIALLDWPQLEKLAAVIPQAKENRRGGQDGRDTSRSGHAMRIGGSIKRAGLSYETMVAALSNHPQTKDWVDEKGLANDGRELERIWERSYRRNGEPPNDDDDEEGSLLPQDGIPIAYSEESLALEFSRRHCDELRYLAIFGHWLIWQNVRWEPEPTLQVFDLARKIARAASAVIHARDTEGKRRWLASAVASAKTVAAIERLARADRRHATRESDWDRGLEVLATTTTTIELKSGAERETRREDMGTKITAVAADRECPTPLWTEFLGRITHGDKALQAYLQRMAGYCTTGLTAEHVLFFLYGTGANGKGVFLNTITDIMNDYAVIAPIELFFESRSDRHPTELAHLWGARLAIAQETERNRRWAEAKVKALTGGDKITARFMRQDFFDFVPRFKLVIAGNHKPSLRGVDEAIRRRIHLVPFTVTIPPGERDLQLREKLKAEWPGILQWMVDGAVAWYRIGLAPPPAVVDASAAYFAEEDRLGEWLGECCVEDKTVSALVVDLFASWQEWSEAANEPPGSRKAFSQNLANRGFRRAHDSSSRKAMFFGLQPAWQAR